MGANRAKFLSGVGMFTTFVSLLFAVAGLWLFSWLLILCGGTLYLISDNMHKNVFWWLSIIALFTGDCFFLLGIVDNIVMVSQVGVLGTPSLLEILIGLIFILMGIVGLREYYVGSRE